MFQVSYNLAVIHIGAPACGMNAAVRSFVRNSIYRGDVVYAVHDGIEGLIAGNIKHLDWYTLFILRSDISPHYNIISVEFIYIVASE